MRKWSEILVDLEKPLDQSRIKTRKQGNTEVPYLEGDDVINTLNRIFGLDGWSSTVADAPKAIPLGTKEKTDWNTKEKIPVEVTLYTVAFTLYLYGLNEDGTEHVITKSDVGKNTAEGAHESMHEMAVSGCTTDAMKRAARQLGPQFGITLYQKDSEDFLSAVGNKSKPASKTTKKTVVKKTSKPVEKETPKQVQDTQEQPQSVLDRALSYVLPNQINGSPIPHGGKTLKQCLSFESALPVLKWIAGLEASPMGLPPLEPEGEDQAKLAAASRYILDHLEEAKAK